MLGMRTRRPAVFSPAEPLDAAAAERLEAEVAGWRAELSTLGTERAAILQDDAAGGGVSARQRALAELDVRKQRLIWAIRESEQNLRAHRRRPLSASVTLDPRDDDSPPPTPRSGPATAQPELMPSMPTTPPSAHGSASPPRPSPPVPPHSEPAPRAPPLACWGEVAPPRPPVAHHFGAAAPTASPLPPAAVPRTERDLRGGARRVTFVSPQRSPGPPRPRRRGAADVAAEEGGGTSEREPRDRAARRGVLRSTDDRGGGGGGGSGSRGARLGVGYRPIAYDLYEDDDDGIETQMMLRAYDQVHGYGYVYGAGDGHICGQCCGEGCGGDGGGWGCGHSGVVGTSDESDESVAEQRAAAVAVAHEGAGGDTTDADEYAIGDGCDGGCSSEEAAAVAAVAALADAPPAHSALPSETHTHSSVRTAACAPPSTPPQPARMATPTFHCVLPPSALKSPGAARRASQSPRMLQAEEAARAAGEAAAARAATAAAVAGSAAKAVEAAEEAAAAAVVVEEDAIARRDAASMAAMAVEAAAEAEAAVAVAAEAEAAAREAAAQAAAAEAEVETVAREEATNLAEMFERECRGRASAAGPAMAAPSAPFDPLAVFASHRSPERPQWCMDVYNRALATDWGAADTERADSPAPKSAGRHGTGGPTQRVTLPPRHASSAPVPGPLPPQVPPQVPLSALPDPSPDPSLRASATLATSALAPTCTVTASLADRPPAEVAAAPAVVAAPQLHARPRWAPSAALQQEEHIDHVAASVVRLLGRGAEGHVSRAGLSRACREDSQLRALFAPAAYGRAAGPLPASSHGHDRLHSLVGLLDVAGAAEHVEYGELRRFVAVVVAALTAPPMAPPPPPPQPSQPALPLPPAPRTHDEPRGGGALPPAPLAPTCKGATCEPVAKGATYKLAAARMAATTAPLAETAALSSHAYASNGAAAVAVRTLCEELRALESTGASADAAASMPDSEMAMALQVAQYEVGLLQGHLQLATRRSETLQATLAQREQELQRTHTQMVEHMRQSGALLGHLARLVPDGNGTHLQAPHAQLPMPMT